MGWWEDYYKKIANSHLDEEFVPCNYCGIEVVQIEFSGSEGFGGGVDWLDKQGSSTCPTPVDAEEWEKLLEPIHHKGEYV